jgi:recombinational DNA repair protein RecT
VKKRQGGLTVAKNARRFNNAASVGERGTTAMTQQIRSVNPADDVDAKGAKSAPTVFFLPFSEDLLAANRGHQSCWQRSPNAEKNALVKANYPSFASSANLSEASLRKNAAPSDGFMTLVPYTQQAMTVRVLHGGKWEAPT